MLKHYGSQCKAVITDNESSLIHRYTTNCYLYEFSVGDETYTGNSLIEVGNKDKIGGHYRNSLFSMLAFF